MPRPNRQPIDMSAESVNLLLQQLYNKNEDLLLAARRDYTEIKKLINNGTPEARAANAVNLETARNNVQRTAREALGNQAALVKLRLDYVMMQEKLKAAPKGDGEESATPAQDERAYMRALAAEMRKEASNGG